MIKKLLAFILLALPLAAQAQETIVVKDAVGWMGATLADDVEWHRPSGKIRRKVVTPPPPPPSTGAIHKPRTSAELQAAIDKAVGGDEIHLAAGLTYSGNFVLPGKPAPVTIRTADLTWSATGRRVKPIDMARMARVQSPNTQPACMLGANADNWRLVGLDISASYTSHTYNVIQIGDLDNVKTMDELPANITIERCLIRGDATLGGRRGVLAMGSNITVRDSHISGFFATGSDTQGILISEGDGFLIENNYIEGAGENIFIASESKMIGQYPTNIVIRRNHIIKRLAWKTMPYVLKNLMETKSGKKIVIEGNVFDNNWAVSQSGSAILWTCRDENGDGQCAIEDVVFRNNLIRNTVNGFSLLGKDDGAANIGRVSGIRIENVLIEGTIGRLLQVINGVEDLTVSRLTALGTATTTMITDMLQNGRITITNSVMGRGSYGMMHSGTQEGAASIAAGWQAGTFTGNVLFPPPCCGQPYPVGNAFVADAASVPTGVGVDRTALNAAIAGVVQ